MLQLTQKDGRLGPFSAIEKLADRYVCDGVHLQFSVVGECTIEDWVGPLPVPPYDPDHAAQLAIQIDADVDALYAAALGNRQSEYELAEAQATAYKAAGYAGTVPASVASWASASGMTAKAACDNILTQAAGWRQAQIAIRTQRLGLKAAAKKAANEAELQAVQAQWSGFLVQIKKMLGV